MSNKPRHAASSLAVLAALTCASAQAGPIQPDNWSYVYDNFSSDQTSATIWGYQSCDREHGHKTVVNGVEKYERFGTAARKGYCGFRCEGSAWKPGATGQDQLCKDVTKDNQYLRFITMPFDRRNAEVQFNADGSIGDNWANPETDDGKGGSETRASYVYDYNEVTPNRGWDLWGENYLVDTNTVRYSWKFRLYNVSMLKAEGNRERLASKAAIGQFHVRSGTSPSGKVCSAATTFSPSPGLYVSVEGESVAFKMSAKLTNPQIPAGLTKCPGISDSEACEVTLWQQSFPMDQVTRVDSSDTHVPPWISVSFVMRPSQTNGALRFFFGVEDSLDAALRYQTRPLGDDSAQWTTAHLPMTQNQCPTQPYLGAYVLGYNKKYYGFLQSDVGRTPIRAEQWVQGPPGWTTTPSSWVNSTFSGKPELDKFRQGTWLSGETPPQFIVDYDDFRIVQVPQLP